MWQNLRPCSIIGEIGENMKKVLMVASESSHFRNFHIPYIESLLNRGVDVYTAANGIFEYKNVVHTTLNFKKKIT